MKVHNVIVKSPAIVTGASSFSCDFENYYLVLSSTTGQHDLMKGAFINV